jgi:hypothetical protein
MTDFQNRILGVVGRKGSSSRVATLLKYCPRILVWDPMADHSDSLPDMFEGIDMDFEVYLEEASQAKTFACAYVPSNSLETEFDEICSLVYEYGRMLFCIEEAPLVCKAGYMPSMFGRMVRTGRHRFIDLLWTAQRASEVSRTLTSSTDLWILYSQTEPRDLDAIAERCGREVANNVAGLGLHDSFVWDAIEREIIPDSPRLLKRHVG